MVLDIDKQINNSIPSNMLELAVYDSTLHTETCEKKIQMYHPSQRSYTQTQNGVLIFKMGRFQAYII